VIQPSNPFDGVLGTIFKVFSIFFLIRQESKDIKKGIENSPKDGMSYRFQSMSEVLIYILKKGKNKYKKELGGT